MSETFLGMSGFIWFIGVVESRLDPLNLGRCQVRCYGWHTDDKELIPTEDLSWAHYIMPYNGSTTSKTPKEGDWVMGFFFDAKGGQAPCIVGVIPGVPEETPNSDKGFADPQDTVNDSTRPSYLEDGNPQAYPFITNEPTTSRLFRNEMTDKTVLGVINKDLTTGVSTSDGSSWDQPTPSYDAKPPYNQVTETESGHVIELDDTPTAERINIAHRKGTYIEIRPDGTKVTKVVADDYEIIAGDNYVNIKGNCNITVEGNLNLYVNGDVTEKVDGNIKQTVGGNVTQDVSGDVTETIGGSRTTTVGGSYDITAGGDFTVKAATINLN